MLEIPKYFIKYWLELENDYSINETGLRENTDTSDCLPLRIFCLSAVRH